MGELFLLRHGETEWSRAGRHTGRTDVPLTSQGESDGRQLCERLHGTNFARIFSSPLARARRTPELAGLSPEIEPDLLEWDYGGYEGLTTAEIRAQGHSGWLIFTDGVVAGPTPGETLEQVAQRGRRVLDRVRPALEAGDVALVGHGHALRVLACDWLGRAPDLGQQLILDAGSVSVLGEEHDVPAIRHWSVSPPG